MKTPLEISLAKHDTTIQVVRQLFDGWNNYWMPLPDNCFISSAQTLMSPLPSGTTTSGKINHDGPSGTSSIVSSSKNSSSFASTFSCNLKGILLTCCASGFTNSSTCSLNSEPFKKPTPLNKCLYLSLTSLSDHQPSTLFA